MAQRPSPRLVSVQALIGLLLAGLFGLLAGCADLDGPGDKRPPDQPTAAAGSTDRGSNRVGSTVARAQLQALLNRWTAAVRDGDRDGLTALISERDPSFSRTAKMIMNNLIIIKPTTFLLQPTGEQRAVSSERAEVLGDGAYAAEVKVSWSVPGDRRPSEQRVWLTVAEDDHDRTVWVGATDGPTGDRSTPLWWLEPVTVVHDQHATVIAGTSADTDAWLERADRAVENVRQRLSGESSPAADWNHRLVVIIPSNDGLLERMLGVGSGAEQGLAAITWPDAESAADAPMRVMINPAEAQSGLSADIVLTHETVHVATASPASPAPTWLIEGFADYIAYDAYPRAEESAANPLLRRVKESGPPAELPDQRAFAATGDDLELAYAEAWLVCYHLAQREGRDRLLAFYTAVDHDQTGRIGHAARSVLGIGHDQLVADWQTYLQQAAARGSI